MTDSRRPTGESVLGTCSGCGAEAALRDGLCPACWYESTDRPKPIRDRYAKLARLQDLGVEPWAYGFDRTHTLPEALGAFEDDGGEEGPHVSVAGRVLSYRDLGGSAFGHLGDRRGRLQVYFKRDLLADADSDLLDLLDLGDWVGVTGPLFRTRTGEVTVRA
jgi:lysyl-tRNA synthetase class 2